jgi:hypothetical protein
MSSELESIGLVEAIRAVRMQLKEATVIANSEDIQFEVEQLELEFSVELKRDAKIKGGIKAWVVSAEAEQGEADSRAHKVKVTLRPENKATGESVMVGDDSPMADAVYSVSPEQ